MVVKFENENKNYFKISAAGWELNLGVVSQHVPS
jgi:hypothetical protein